MSIPTPLEARQMTARFKKEREQLIAQKMDPDIQKLVKEVRATIETTEPDKKGYYTFLLPITEIQYEDWEMVLQRFIKNMTDSGYIIQIKRETKVFKSTGKYIVSFRANV